MATQAVANRSGPTRYPRRSAHMAGTASAFSFVWDGTDVLNEYVNGGLSGRYLTLDGEVLSEKRGASRYVYGVEPLGSVVHLLDSGLNRAGTYVYWPYGEVQSHTGVDTPMQFVGGLGYYTATTNRLYVRARWLRVDLGRWMTEDPIGFDGGDWHLYGYVASSPTTSVDPDGRQVLRRRRRQPWPSPIGIWDGGWRFAPPPPSHYGCPAKPPVVCFWCVYNELATGYEEADRLNCMRAKAACGYTGGIECPVPPTKPPRAKMCVEPPGADYSCSEQQHLDCQLRCKKLYGVGNGIHICTHLTGCQCLYWLIDAGPAEVYEYGLA